MHFKLLILVLGISRAISKSDVRSHAEAMVAVSANGGMVDHSAVRRVGNSNAGSRAELLDAAVLRENTPSRRSAEKTSPPVTSATDCTVPDTTGYDFDGFTGNVSATNFDLTGVVCASGYSGSVDSVVCPSAGTMFTLTGCQTTCVVPNSAGYNFSNSVGNLTISGFNATGVACESGYVGSVTVYACSLPGDPYTVSGCVAVHYLNKGRGEFCDGNPGGINEGVYANTASCQAACTANANCVAYDWDAAEEYTWCVIAEHCTVVYDVHSRWTHVEKL
jgi:hypothetical protein